MKKILSLLLIALLFNSCKKDLAVDKSNHLQSSVDMRTLSYQAFLKDVNINRLGVLKNKLTSNHDKKLLSIADDNTLGVLAVYTDSVRQIINNGDTSYVFQMALTSPKSISFRNLSINVANGKTSAFIATYTPTKLWIDARKINHQLPFDGNISFAEINLSGTTMLQALSFDSSTSKLNGKIMSIDGKKMLTETICNYYTVYDVTIVPCTRGAHMPWDKECGWNNGYPVDPGEQKAYYIWNPREVEVCSTTTTPDPSVPSGGGGGSTPIPPVGYDPCTGLPINPPLVEYAQNKGGLKLAVIAPTPCDVGDTGGLTPLPPRVDTTNHILNNCLNSALSKALGKNVKSKIKDLMVNTFLANSNYNINFYSFPFTNPADANSDAKTLIVGNTTSLIADIALNENLLLNKSQEYIVATIYHEILHAYLGKLFPQSSQGIILIPNDHEYILDKFVSTLTNDLKTIFPNMSDVDAYSLAMGGLQYTPRYSLLSQQTRDMINNIQNSYSKRSNPPLNNNDSKGSYCQ